MPQAAAQDDWGDAHAQAAPDARFEWGDEKAQAAPQPGPATAKAAAPVAPPSRTSRFLSGLLDTDPMPSVEDLKAHPVANNPLIPGTGIYRDIKGGNYAGAAGRIARPAVALAPFLFGHGAEEPMPQRPMNVRGPGEIAPEMPRVPQARSAGAPELPARPGLLLKGEVARPSTVSPPRDFRPINVRAPGEIPTEMPRAPRAYSPGAPPILSRQGLMLKGEVARPSAPNPAIAPIETGEAAPAPTRIQKPSWTPPRASQFNTIEIGGPEDIAETRGIQEGIRDQADQETDALRKRGNEEGFSRNTRPRIGKGEMAKNFRSSGGSAVGEQPVKLTSTPSVKSAVAKPSAKASGKSSPRLGSGSETDDLTDLLEQSVRQAKAKKK